MITAACPRPQTVRARITYHIPEQSPSSPEHAGALGGVAAVLFEVELAFEGVVDGLDDLAQRFEELGARPFRFSLAGGAQQAKAAVGQDGLEVMTVVVLVRDDDLAVAAGGQGGVRQDAWQDLPLVGFGAGQGEADGQPVQGAQQVQPQSPK